MTNETTNQQAALYCALAKAQAQMNNAPLNKINPHFKSKYADLAAVRDAVIPALSDNGIAVVQLTKADEAGMPVLVTMLCHSEGGTIQSETPICADASKPQPYGSGLTYARRYGLAAIVCISSDEDDDANTAQASDAQPRKMWHGPLKTMELKAKARDFGIRLNQALSVDALNALIDEYRPVLDQLALDLPEWWIMEDDQKGAYFAIENKRSELEAASLQG